MRRPRRHRGLTEGEARLWGEIAKLITPLRGRAVPKATAPAQTPPGMPAEAAAPSRGEPVSSPPGRPAAAPPAKPAPPAVAQPFAPGAVRAPAPARPKRPLKLTDLGLSAPMAAPMAAPVAPRPAPAASPAPSAPGLEWRERRNLQRGLLPIEARIDLHGLYQAEAHAALVGFLMRSRAAGHARVLVVTGKGAGFGGAGIGDGFSERGVLRRQVPHWLRGAELRSVVLGFEEAARHHGGQGALYVRLRRR